MGVDDRGSAKRPGKGDSRHKRRGKGDRRKKTRRKTPATSGITLRLVQGDEYELVFPRQVLQLSEDIEEVCDMILHEEWDIAADELEWLISQCPALLEAYQLLGRIELFRGNLKTAQGHLGCAMLLGFTAGLSKCPGRLPFKLANNRPFLLAARDLAECSIKLGDLAVARNVLSVLLNLDPDDPLHARELWQRIEERPSDNVSHKPGDENLAAPADSAQMVDDQATPPKSSGEEMSGDADVAPPRDQGDGVAGTERAN